MRFLVIHKSNEENEAGVPPSPELVDSKTFCTGVVYLTYGPADD